MNGMGAVRAGRRVAAKAGRALPLNDLTTSMEAEAGSMPAVAAIGKPGTRDVRVRVCRLAENSDLPLPVYATEGSAGADIAACVETPVVLHPRERASIGTGLRIALPEGYEAEIRPRSGLAARHGLTLLNAPGTIDADYRGEIRILLVNLGDAPVTIGRGDRIAQMLVRPVARARFEEATVLPPTGRGEGGFGHTGD